MFSRLCFFLSDTKVLIFSDLHEKKSINKLNTFKLLTIVKLLNIFFWILWEKVLPLPQFMNFKTKNIQKHGKKTSSWR